MTKLSTELGPRVDTFSGDAVENQVLSGRAVYVDGRRITGEYPNNGMMKFDGVEDHYVLTGFTPVASGNKVSAVIRFNRDSYLASESGTEFLMNYRAGGSGHGRLQMYVLPSDYATTDRAGRLHVIGYNSTGTKVYQNISDISVIDGEDHMVFFSLDADAGTDTFIIDGVAVADTGNADYLGPSIYSMPTGATSTMFLGSTSIGLYTDGHISHFGVRDAYLTNYQDFMSGSSPKIIDESSWTEWGAQPLFWNRYGLMTDNKGSTGNMTMNGAVSGPWLDRYQPDMRSFDGSTGYYSQSAVTTSGNKTTVVMRFNRPAFTGDRVEILCTFDAGGAGRFGAVLVSSDYSTDVARQSKVYVFSRTGAGSNICQLISLDAVCDGTDKVLFYSFDGDAGTATFRIDGINVSDITNPIYVAPIIGTLATGTTTVNLGAGFTGQSHIDGDIGYFGYKDAYLTNYQDFMDGNQPKQIDDVGWTEWGGQPLYWNETGLMTDNKGSAGNMTANGTITNAPYIAPVVNVTRQSDFFDYVDTSDANALAADIELGKKVWVDGVEIIGTTNTYETTGTTLGDGTDYFTRTNWLPSDGGDMTMVISFKTSDDTSAAFYIGGNVGSNRQIFELTKGSGDDVNCEINRQLNTAGAFLISSASSDILSNVNDFQVWSSFVVTMTAAGNWEMWHNGVDVTGAASMTAGTMDFTGTTWFGDWFAGGNAGSWVDFSHIWIAHEYVDMSADYSKFFDVNHKPISLGSDGSTPTGRQPEHFAPDGNLADNLGTESNWTAVGSPAASSTSPSD